MSLYPYFFLSYTQVLLVALLLDLAVVLVALGLALKYHATINRKVKEAEQIRQDELLDQAKVVIEFVSDSRKNSNTCCSQ